MSDSSENTKAAFWLWVMYGYFAISQIMTVVFFIRYCRTDSVLEVMFLDTWLSELKGLLWIFFI